MFRQAIAALCILLGGFGLASPFTNKANAQSDALHRVSCGLSHSSVMVRFGMTKHPTNFGVITPDDKILYLVDPAKGIDHLGKAYREDTLALEIANLKGTKLDHGARSTKAVFNVAGRYTLLFEDANRAEYEDLHAFSCDIDIPGELLTQNGDGSQGMLARQTKQGLLDW